MTIAILIFLALTLVLLNGFFVAAEFALVKIRGSQLEALKSQEGFRVRILKKMHRQMDEYLSACQLGITLASLGLGWVGEPAFADLFEKMFHNIEIAHAAATLLAFALAFFLISYLHIVVGELAPKSLAIRKVEQIALVTAIPLYFFYHLMYPLIWLLNQSANQILKLMGIQQQQTEHVYSAEELKVILTASHMHDDLSQEDLRILNRVLDFTELTVADVMRPIHELKLVGADQPVDETLNIIAKYHFTRYPIYENEDRDKIIGVLHIKDLLEYSLQKTPMPSIKDLKRPILEFPVETAAIEIFHEFRRGSAQFAIVVNEVGKAVGFVTLDDILSEALGSISDEFITPHRDWFLTKEGNYIVFGYTSLYTIERLLDIDLTDESNTLSGLILSTLERMPEANEVVSFPQFDLQVLKVNGPKIELVKLTPRKKVLT
jgi:CBS domain containing-hemolysin-like protein